MLNYKIVKYNGGDDEGRFSEDVARLSGYFPIILARDGSESVSVAFIENRSLHDALKKGVARKELEKLGISTLDLGLRVETMGGS